MSDGTSHAKVTQPVALGLDVRVRAEIIPRLVSSARKIAENRVAVVLGVYTPMGGRDPQARIQWRHRRTGRPTGTVEHWPTRDLEVVSP